MTIKQTAGHDALGEFAPEFAHLNDDILFGEVWNREDKLPLKLRSIVTVSALIGKGITDSSLKYHLASARTNGVTREDGRNPHPYRLLRRMAQRLGGLQHGQRSVCRRREPNRVAPRHKT